MSELLQSGLIVTVVGMGAVLVLLTLLVYVIEGMSRLSRLLEPHAAAAPAGRTYASADEEEIAGVVAAAISLYRSRHGMLD